MMRLVARFVSKNGKNTHFYGKTHHFVGKKWKKE
jgi:hypothetical protein